MFDREAVFIQQKLIPVLEKVGMECVGMGWGWSWLVEVDIDWPYFG